MFCRQRSALNRRALTDEFNNHFDTEASVDQLRAFCKRNRVLTGRTGLFEHGSVSHNKGRKGWSAPGSEATRFKPGDAPVNRVPIGTYRMTTPIVKRNGAKEYSTPPYWRLKVAEGSWEFVHRLEWQAHHGPIKKGQVIIMVDGDSLNPEINNLECVTRGDLAVLNRHSDFSSAPVKLRRTIILITKLKQATRKHQNNNQPQEIKDHG